MLLCSLHPPVRTMNLLFVSGFYSLLLLGFTSTDDVRASFLSHDLPPLPHVPIRRAKN